MAFTPFTEQDRPTMENFNEKFVSLFGAGVQISEISYTGTGTYGASNPTSITFDFAPDVVIAMGCERDGSYIQKFSTTYQGGHDCNFITYTKFIQSNAYTGSVVAFYDGNDGSTLYNNCFGKKSEDGKTLSWYSLNGAYSQLNYSGDIWHFIGIKFPEGVSTT